MAVTVTVVWEATVPGAVYRPFAAMLPVAGLIDQVTLAPEGKFRTENCLVAAGATVAVVGLRLVGGGVACKVRVAVPRRTLVDAFFAVRVTVVCVATVAGAV